MQTTDLVCAVYFEFIKFLFFFCVEINCNYLLLVDCFIINYSGFGVIFWNEEILYFGISARAAVALPSWIAFVWLHCLLCLLYMSILNNKNNNKNRRNRFYSWGVDAEKHNSTINYNVNFYPLYRFVLVISFIVCAAVVVVVVSVAVIVVFAYSVIFQYGICIAYLCLFTRSLLSLCCYCSIVYSFNSFTQLLCFLYAAHYIWFEYFLITTYVRVEYTRSYIWKIWPK